jgi:hypothetical protein
MTTIYVLIWTQRSKSSWNVKYLSLLLLNTTSWGSGGIAPRILNLSTRWRWMMRLMPQLLPRIETHAVASGLAPEPVWTLWRGEKTHAPAGNLTQLSRSSRPYPCDYTTCNCSISAPWFVQASFEISSVLLSTVIKVPQNSVQRERIACSTSRSRSKNQGRRDELERERAMRVRSCETIPLDLTHFNTKNTSNQLIYLIWTDIFIDIALLFKS